MRSFAPLFFKIMIDLHIHTEISHDSCEKAENYILRAIACGAEAIGFSEHYDYDAYLDGDPDSRLPDLEKYFDIIEGLSRKFPNIKILKGVELGYRADAAPHYNKLLKDGNFDYSILSVHTVKGRGDCYFPAFYNGLTKEQSYSLYLNAVLESVRSDINFDIVGHLGYIARYSPYADKRLTYSQFPELIDSILTEIISRGKYLEINTSVNGGEEIAVPCEEILKRYISLGGQKFSFGSDSHTADKFMRNFEKAEKLLLRIKK